MAPSAHPTQSIPNPGPVVSSGKHADWVPLLADLHDPRWGDNWPPPWFEPDRWPGQLAAILQIMDAFTRGVRLVMLDAPTGAGKTFIAEAVRRLLRVRYSVYVCSDLALQSQFCAAFPYVKRIQGRGNYATLDEPELAELEIRDPRYATCADCTRSEGDMSCGSCPPHAEPDVSHCMFCHGPCPYVGAREEALRTLEGACTNSSYFLYQTNSGPAYVDGDKRTLSEADLVIVDECCRMEEELFGYVTVQISPYRMGRLGLSIPDKVTVASEWETWIRCDALPAVDAALVPLKGKTRVGQKRKLSKSQIRDKQYYEALKDKLDKLKGAVANGNWVLSDYSKGGVTFKPVRVAEFGQQVLWRHAKRWLHMSATILSPEQHVADLGYEGSYEYVQMPSSYEKERCPVRLVPVANIKGKKGSPERIAGERDAGYATQQIINAHPTERVLVHAVSYSLAQALRQQMSPGRAMFTYSNSKEKQDVLEEFRRTPNAVLFAPSLDRGVDLKYDDCRVVVIAKMPWGDLSDKQILARKYASGGQLWYSVQALRKVIQQAGRAMRAADDSCVVYVTDASACETLTKFKRIVPQWFAERLVRTGPWAKQFKRPTGLAA